jgi:hypothetical protein
MIRAKFGSVLRNDDVLVLNLVSGYNILDLLYCRSALCALINYWNLCEKL